MRSATIVTLAMGALLIVGCAAPTPTPSQPAPSAPSPTAADPTAVPTPGVTATPAPSPLSVEDVIARLLALEPTLTLEPQPENPTGGLPDLRFRAMVKGSPDALPRIGLVLLFPTSAVRKAAQPNFGADHISGPNGTENWDGVAHSEWVGVGNALVEALMPGGFFGGRSPTPADLAYPAKVRAALEHVPTP
jgi:hypothetical protein